MNTKVHSETKPANAYTVHAGGNTDAYDMWVATKNAIGYSGAYVAFSTEEEAAAHGQALPCYICAASDGFAIYHRQARNP